VLSTADRNELRAELVDLVAAVRPSDTLLAVGSLSNGLGSSSAELDLLLIGPGTQYAGISASVASMSSASYQLASGRAIKIRFCTDRELLAVSELVNRFEHTLLEPSMGLNLPPMDLTTRVLLHELRSGVVLANDSVADSWRQSLRLEQLPVYLAAQHLQQFAARRQNVEWHLKDDEWESALWTLREGLEELMVAVLAAAGETNPRKRWHLQLLRRHGAEFGDETVEALIRLLCEWPADEPHDAIRRAWEVSDGLLEAVVRRRPELSTIVDVATRGV
jgi:hypothetical protein